MKKYLLSELIKDGIEILTKNGDMEVVADVLTANQSNLFDVCGGLDVFHGKCHVTLDLNDFTVPEIKKRIK